MREFKEIEKLYNTHPDNLTRAEFAYMDMLALRDVQSPCKKCGGRGVRTYGNTSTWKGGIGGQAMTTGVCDSCWGSGDKNRPWTNLRKLHTHFAAVDRLVKAMKDLLRDISIGDGKILCPPKQEPHFRIIVRTLANYEALDSAPRGNARFADVTDLIAAVDEYLRVYGDGKEEEIRDGLVGIYKEANAIRLDADEQEEPWTATN